jgi:hypothetical protein
MLKLGLRAQSQRQLSLWDADMVVDERSALVQTIRFNLSNRYDNASRGNGFWNTIPYL